LNGTSEEVTKLEGLDKIGVPDHAAVLDTNVGEVSIDVVDLLYTLIERLLSSEDGNVGLHDLLHLEADFGSRLRAIRCTDLVENGDGISTSISGDGISLLARAEVIADSVGNSTTEDDKIEERVGTKTVSSVDGDGGSFTTSEQTWDDLIITLGILSDDLTSVLGRNTTHVVVDRGENRDGLLGDIDTSEDSGSLRNTR
jgi:hypothetical protein